MTGVCYPVCVIVPIKDSLLLIRKGREKREMGYKNIRKEGNVLFNDTLNTFYLQLYGIRHMVNGHLDSERGNLLLPHRLLCPFSSKGSFIYTIIQTG